MVTKIKVEFKYAQEYKLMPIAGAVGSPVSDGLVMCHLYTERFKVPCESEIVVDASGKTSEKPFAADVLEREAHFGMVLTPHKARIIGQWLIDTANQVDINPPSGTPKK